MIDMEKIIELLTEIAEYFRGCRDNASFASKAENHFWELQNAANEAVELLKEQEAKWIHREDLDFKDKLGYHHFHGMCGNCGFIHDFIDGHTGQYKYCPQCGKAAKWE